jgi:hypothetical protein
MLLYFWIIYGVQNVAGTTYLSDGVLTTTGGWITTTGFIGAMFLVLAMLTSLRTVLSEEQQKGNLSYATESTFFYVTATVWLYD